MERRCQGRGSEPVACTCVHVSNHRSPWAGHMCIRAQQAQKGKKRGAMKGNEVESACFF